MKPLAGHAILLSGLFVVSAYTHSWLGCVVSAGVFLFLAWAARE